MTADEARAQDQQTPGPTQDRCNPVAARNQNTHAPLCRGQTCDAGEPSKTPGAIGCRRPACIVAGNPMNKDAARRQDQQTPGVSPDHGVPFLARKQVMPVAHVWAKTCEPVATSADYHDEGNVQMFGAAHGQGPQEPGHPSDPSVPFAAPKQKTHVAHVRATTCTTGGGLPTHLRTANDWRPGHEADDEAEACSHSDATAAVGSPELDARFWARMDSKTRPRTPTSDGRKTSCIANGTAPISRGARGKAQPGPRHAVGHCVPTATQKRETHVAHFWARTCIPPAGPPVRQNFACSR